MKPDRPSIVRRFLKFACGAYLFVSPLATFGVLLPPGGADTVVVSPSPNMTPLPESIAESIEGGGFTAKLPLCEPALHRFVRAGIPEIGIAANGLLWAGLVPNLGLKIHVKGPWSVGIDGMYAAWSRPGRHRYYRIKGGNIALNYRLNTPEPNNSFTGHHLGLYASLLCYDLQFGGRGVLSDKYNYAVGLSYTWSLPLTRRLNLDLSVGAGYLWGRYEKHRPIDDHDVWTATRRIGWFGPTQAGVSLVWNIGSGKGNAGKGGDR